ncbi:MAG: phosphoribosylglycinamide formyltransferase [Candidatus Omnitrophica bacterium]|nr:phosphoribosylglycinamide formyltransferase [Candidatus Omnitrophota bacterium]
MRIAVFASGRGSNFNAIAKAIKSQKIKASLALLICDNPDAAVILKAKRFGVKTFLIKRADYKDKPDFENKIIQVLQEEKISLIVLAGFMRILSNDFVLRFKNKIINIHPSLLPAFKGSHAILDAFNYGAKVTGVTVHFVDELMDHGPIILQQALKIEENDTLESLEAKIHKIEHRLYPEAIRLCVQARLKIKGRKVHPALH